MGFVIFARFEMLVVVGGFVTGGPVFRCEDVGCWCLLCILLQS